LAEVRLVEPLLRALDDSDYDEHRWALWALGQLNDRPAVEAVAARLHHSDWRERCLAALALQNQPTEVAIGGLIESWRDKVAFVRLAVVIALGHSAEAAALEILRAALNDTDWWVRFAAIEALARLKDSDSVEALAHQLFEADTDLASQTIFALQRIGDRRAIPHLQRIAADDTRTDERGWAVSEHARHAIGVLEGSMK
jgi:HEAT repeat protein